MKSQTVMKRELVRFTFAAGMRARASDLRRLLRCLALGAAVLARRCHTRTNGVCTLFSFGGRHFFSPSFGSTAGDPRRHLKHLGDPFLSDKGHISMFGRSAVVRPTSEAPPRLRKFSPSATMRSLVSTIYATRYHRCPETTC